MGSFIEDHLEPRWPRYGLRGDPFFSNPLDPETETTRPITLFEGREQERRRLDQTVLDGNHSATLIYAAGGYGKTTLANAASYDLSQEGYLVLPEEIVFTPGSDVDAFFRELIHGILQAVSDHGLELPDVPSNPQEIEEEDRSGLIKARMAVQLTRVRSGTSAGGSIMGTGAEGSVAYDFLRPAHQLGASRALLREIMGDITALDPSIAGVIVRVNNLDVAVKKDEDAVQHFLLEARDLLQVDGLHFFMMGNDVVRDLVESEPRVQSVFQAPLPLGSLDVEEVLAILRARYRFLEIEDASYTEPVADSLVQELHGVHYGDLRNILRDLGRSVQMVDPVEADPVQAEQALPLLEEAHFRRLDERISQGHWRTLSTLGRFGEARQTDIAEELGVEQATISRRFQKLTEENLVDLQRIEGRSHYYRLPGNVRLALEGARRSDRL